MAAYYVNDNEQASSGDHEVHVSTCSWVPLINSKTYLGDYSSCSGAVSKAKMIYPSSDAAPTAARTVTRARAHNGVEQQ